MLPIQVRIFTDCSEHINPPIESRINGWLSSKTNIEIVRILQSESMVTQGEQAITHSLSISIFFREPS